MILHCSRLFVIVLLVVLCSFTLGKTVVDLQWAICDQDAETVLHKLGKSGKEAYKANNITYYDALPPVYTAKGLAFRTKVKKHGKRAYPISLIKARFDEETGNVPPKVDCVWDRYGNSTYYTCGLPFPLHDGLKEKHIWSEDQVAFAERYQHVNWDSLVPYGPYLNPKWKLHIEGYKAVFDDVMAFAGDSPLHLMEIEVEAKKSKDDEVHKKITEYLRSCGVVICEEPELSKTLRLFDALDRSSMTALDRGQSVLREASSRQSERKGDLKR